MKNYRIITLYPDALKPYLKVATLGRGQKKELVKISTTNLRDFGLGKYKQVDDTPYGGGPGMILRPDVVVPAIRAARRGLKGKTAVIITSPTGQPFTQKTAGKLSKYTNLIIIAGRFEGYDARIDHYIDYQISVGPYVLSGGELPALTIIETVTRLIPGVLGNEESLWVESFHGSDQKREHPQYTKPATYDQLTVPSVLTSGDHQKIAQWRQKHQA